MVEFNVHQCRTNGDVIGEMRNVLQFPDWCGSGWDCVEDAFEDLRQVWRFPLMLLIFGLQPLVSTQPHLGLQTVIRLSALQSAFSVSGDQLLPIYVWG